MWSLLKINLCVNPNMNILYIESTFFRRLVLLISLIILSAPSYAVDWGHIYSNKKRYHSGVVTLATAQLILNQSNLISFEQAAKFIIENPNLPQINEMKIKLEGMITESTDYNAVYKWFSNNIPITDHGCKAYAYSAAAINPMPKDLARIIKDGWIYGDFSDEEQKNYQKLFGKYLNTHDHVRKIDYLLWHDKTQAAKKLLKLVSAEYHQMFNAQIALQKEEENGVKLFRALPKPLQLHSGVLYHYLNSTGKKQVSAEHTRLFIAAPNNDDHPEEWLASKLYYARELLEAKQYASAYKVVSTINPHLSNSGKADAEWLSGWIALRFLHNPKVAAMHFQKMYELVSTPVSLSRGAYWLARSFKAQKKQEKANIWFKKAAAFNYSFYGALASAELGVKKLILPTTPKIVDNHHHNLKKNPLAQAMRFLIDNKENYLASLYATAAIAHAEDDGEAYLILDALGKETDSIFLRTNAAKAAAQRHIFITKYVYPTPYKVPHTTVEPAFIYSIIRQESVFDHKAVSKADARGLMQVLPKTASTLCKRHKLQFNAKKLTANPLYNMTLGSSYLKDLLAEFNGSYILTIASYNAGDHKVVKWLPKFGDPRKMKNLYEIIDWIESIPYGETRNYVQRVMENIQVYRTILNPAVELGIEKDLRR